MLKELYRHCLREKCLRISNAKMSTIQVHEWRLSTIFSSILKAKRIVSIYFWRFLECLYQFRIFNTYFSPICLHLSTVYESFKDYIAKETLEGDNKYDAGEHGLQDAEKGVIFVKFPPVLHLHLMRFQYDPITDNSVKFNDRFEFYEQINLDPYLQSPEETPADYILHAVLVHSGDNHGGHYVVYINPYGDGKWCKFDDDVVSKCNKAEAIEHNYGGIDDDLSLNAKHCSNAYMLVYIRKSAMPQVLQEIKESDIPSELIDRLAEERRMEQVRRRERSEANTYITINVLLEEYFEGHQTTELFDLEKVHCRQFKMKKTQTIADLMNTFKDAFYTPISHMRLWPLVSRQNQLARPSFFYYKDDQNKSIIQCAELQNPWMVFLELLPPDSGQAALPPFNKERNVLLFFKVTTFHFPCSNNANTCYVHVQTILVMCVITVL